MPGVDEEPWWERCGINPTEITASVEAALVGDAVALHCVDDASPALLRTLAERVVPLMGCRAFGSRASSHAHLAKPSQSLKWRRHRREGGSRAV